MTTQPAVPVIPLNLDHSVEDGMPTVNARDLYAFLEVGSEFKDWIARRIREYGLKEDEDFRSFLSESTGGRPAKEYHLTLDMAKELSMVEKNKKGREARRYFIACEKQLREEFRHGVSQSRYMALLEENRELNRYRVEHLERRVPRKARPVTDEDRQRMVDLYEEGNTFYRIAKIMDRSQSLIANHLRKAAADLPAGELV